MGAPVAKAVLRARIAAGICRNSPTHGKATRGQVCEGCAQRRKVYNDRRRQAEAPATALSGDFWSALQDLYYAGRL
jgi:hypothetical protein